MTSCERAAAALNHREPDRAPIDLGSSEVTGAMVTAYAALRERLGVKGEPPRVIELLQMLAEV